MLLAMVALLLCLGCDRSDKQSTDQRRVVVTSPAEPRLLFEERNGSGIDFTYRNGEEAGHLAILESVGGGIGAIDFDADGWTDLVIPGGGKFVEDDEPAGLPAGLFRAIGPFQFKPVAGAARLDQAKHYSHGATVFDFNNDGFQDILITGYGGLQFFWNTGDGTFTEEASKRGLVDSLWSSSAAAGDLNGDGNPDLYIAHYLKWTMQNNPNCGWSPEVSDICPPAQFEPLSDTLYLNDSTGLFEDGSSAWNLQPGGKGLGVVIGDADLDGDCDIYVGNDTVPNFLYRNHGETLEEVGVISGTSQGRDGRAEGSMGVDLNDFDLDGLPDLWVVNYESEGISLYFNQGSCVFHPDPSRIALVPSDRMNVSWGTALFDADLDGDSDAFVSNGHVIRFPRSATVRQRPLVLASLNGQKMINVARKAGEYSSQSHMGRGLTLSDFDHDGDQDLAVSHTNEPVAILENLSPSDGNWIGFRLIGTVSSRDATGAVVRVLTESGEQVKQIKGGSSFASTMDRSLVFGLGKATTILNVTVRWPSGVEQSFKNAATQSQHVIIESSTKGLD